MSKLVRYIFQPRASLFDAMCIGIGFGLLIDYGFLAFIAFGFVCCIVSSVIETRLFEGGQK